MIPSSNSMMAKNLFHLGTLLYEDDYISLAKKMSGKMVELIPNEPEYLSNWADLVLKMSDDFAEIVILGPKYQAFAREFQKRHLPSKVVIAGAKAEGPDALAGKTMKQGKTTIFVCYNRTCKLPVTSVEEALKQLK